MSRNPRERGYHPRRLFTLEEANGALPLVSRVIGDIVRVHAEMVELHAEAEKLAEEGRTVRAEELGDRLRDLADQVEAFASELEGIGCLCKDPRLGLVDFPAKMEGRVVFLCWKLGEEEIRYWHEIDAGFAGRKTVRGVFA